MSIPIPVNLLSEIDCWQPTMELQWVYKITDQSDNHTLVLQQKFHNAYKLTEEWRDIKIVNK